MLECKISVMLNLLHFFHLTVTERASASKEIWECHVTGHACPKWRGWMGRGNPGRTSSVVGDLLLTPVAFLKWVCTKSTKEKVKYWFLPLCVRQCCTSHSEGFYVTIKTKLCFTFSNLTEVNAEPLNWHTLSQHRCTTFCYLIQVPLPSLVGLSFHLIP